MHMDLKPLRVDMKNFKKWFAYTLYVIGLVLFFLYMCFPEDSFTRYIENLAARAAPGLETSVDGLGPGLPPSMSAKNIAIRYRGSEPVLLERLEVTPRYLDFFIGKPFFNISTEAAEGLIKGRLGIKDAFGEPQISLQMELNGLRMETFDPVFKEISSHAVEGGFEGKIQYSGPFNLKGTGEAVFWLGEGVMRLTPPFYGIDKIEFSQAQAQMEMKNRNVTISDFSLNGRQFSLKGNGRIILSFPVEESRVNVSARVTPHAALRKSLGDFLPSKYKRRNEIPMRITGTIGRPNLSIR